MIVCGPTGGKYAKNLPLRGAIVGVRIRFHKSTATKQSRPYISLRGSATTEASMKELLLSRVKEQLKTNEL